MLCKSNYNQNVHFGSKCVFSQIKQKKIKLQTPSNPQQHMNSQ